MPREVRALRRGHDAHRGATADQRGNNRQRRSVAHVIGVGFERYAPHVLDGSAPHYFNPENNPVRAHEIINCGALAPDFVLSTTQVNAAMVPRNLFAARVVQGISTSLRSNGAQRIVNTLKVLLIKKWLHAVGEKLRSERVEIRKQSGSFSETLTEDWKSFERQDAFGAVGTPAKAMK